MKNSKSWQRLRALLYKEFVQLLRDRRTLLMLIFMPLVELVLMAYAVNLSVTNLPTAVLDQSLDSRSQDFIGALVNSGNFQIVETVSSQDQMMQDITAGKVKAGVVIPPNFSEDVARGNGNVLILLDGSDQFSVESGYSAAVAITQKYSLDLTAEKINQAGSALAGTPITGNLPVVTSTRILYNPNMDSMVFILPALIAMIMQMLTMNHSAMVVVRERETGVSEQLLATPARPLELIIAKLMPGLVLVALDLFAVMGIGIAWFKVSFRGNFLLFAGLSVLFILSCMALGLLISAVARTQRQAQQINGLISLPMMLLTGFLYPRATMPMWTKAIGDLFPLTYFIRIIRGIFTKGVGLSFVWTDAVYLSFYAVLVLILAALLTKKRLD